MPRHANKTSLVQPAHMAQGIDTVSPPVRRATTRADGLTSEAACRAKPFIAVFTIPSAQGSGRSARLSGSVQDAASRVSRPIWPLARTVSLCPSPGARCAVTMFP